MTPKKRKKEARATHERNERRKTAKAAGLKVGVVLEEVVVVVESMATMAGQNDGSGGVVVEVEQEGDMAG